MNPAEVSSIERLKEAMRQPWTDPARVVTWRKWSPQFFVQSRAATEVILQAGGAKPGTSLLDLASGTGEPALSLAAMVGPSGHVMATDIAGGILTIAQEHARKRGLTNITFQEADAHALPFRDQTFDLVTCRFGVMYFADHEQALREARRVLKPGGRAIFVAWGPFEQNPYFTSTVGTIRKYVDIPPDPVAPDPFRFGQPGTLSAALHNAGFHMVQEDLHFVRWVWPGPMEELWERVLDADIKLKKVVENMEGARRDQGVREVYAAMREFFDGRQVDFPAVIVLASGVNQGRP